MPLNGSELIDQPWDTIFSPFTDLLGSGFYLIPIAIIGAALYVKTREPIVISSYMLGVGSILTGVGLFAGFPDMVDVFGVMTVLGIVGLIASIFFMKK